MSEASILNRWPALAGLPNQLPARLLCERGVLGKTPGSPADFSWIAASEGFSGLTTNLARHLALGNEDVHRDSVLLWRSDGRRYQAVRCYPAQAPDARGRSFLEKQVLEWERPDELPATLGALVLLPLVATLGDAIWRDRDELKGGGGWELATLDGSDLPQPIVDAAALGRGIVSGLAELRRRFREEDLGDLYARLLAGQRGVFPPEPIEALPPAALAALMLPLPREIADRLSLVGWLPSTLVELSQLGQRWDLVLGGDIDRYPRSSVEVEGEHAGRGLALAEAVYRSDPRSLPAPVPTAPTVMADQNDQTPTRLTLWGPSGSGKTVFLGQLYWQVNSAIDGDWDIFPGEHGLEYLQVMRDQMYSRNVFPPPTQVGSTWQLVCHLVHRRTGRQITLTLEDRAGADFEAVHEDVLKLLLEADGIILLLDPDRQDDKVYKEVSDTFERMMTMPGRVARKERRPVAVCVTKADILIEAPADFRLALEEPARFAERHVNRRLLGYMRNRFEAFELFAASAAGVRMQHGAIEPVAFLDETLRPRINSGEPFNLLAPIDWLIGQVQV
jgi:5S rRNA maturation endonuclease (ribonuclease M5)